MNVELTRIAQKKLDQMGATVHGVLVKNQAGAWAAVSEAGRVMWLDGFEGQAATPYTNQLDSGAALECPYACGWEALRSIITKNAAYFARATMDDEVSEPVRQAGIAGNQYAIELCRAAMSAPAPHPEGDGWVRCDKQQLRAIANNLQYAGFNLCDDFDFSRIQGAKGRTVESTCPEASLLIAIRDLSELIGEPLPQPPQQGGSDK